MGAIEFLSEVLPLEGRHVLDIGCGNGQLAKIFASLGASVTGVDPSFSAIQAARDLAPRCRFQVAFAEVLPFPDGAFDYCIFLNSLHHVPAEQMGAAIWEAVRATESGGQVVVVEPLAEGSFFDVFRLIEDETEVRRAAQLALGRAERERLVKPVRSQTIIRSESFASFEAFVTRAVAAAPERGDAMALHRDAIEDRFLGYRVGAEPVRLDQPLKIDFYQAVNPAA